MPFLLRLELPDVPGSLGRVASAIGDAGADIEAIQVVQKTPDGTAVIDDVLLELPPGKMPDSVVSACSVLDGVRVLWISRYAAGGNLFLDLELVEEITAHPEHAYEKMLSLVPVTFRADWAARLRRGPTVTATASRSSTAPRPLPTTCSGSTSRTPRTRRAGTRTRSSAPSRRTTASTWSAAAAGRSSSTPRSPASPTWSGSRGRSSGPASGTPEPTHATSRARTAASSTSSSKLADTASRNSSGCCSASAYPRMPSVIRSP